MVYEENLRDFKGVWIDKRIWLDKRLNALEKVILTEIDSLDNGKGCFASNKYLAEFCQCSERKITDTISKLIGLDLLEFAHFDGRIRVLRVNRASQFFLGGITKSARRGNKNCGAHKNNNKAINKNSSFDIDDFARAAIDAVYKK